MFWLPREVLVLIYAFDGTYREIMGQVLREQGALLVATHMVLDRGFTIRNYVETRWHQVPRYVMVDPMDKSVERGGHYLRFNKYGRRCFGYQPL